MKVNNPTIKAKKDILKKTILEKWIKAGFIDRKTKNPINKEYK